MVEPIYIPTDSVGGFPFLWILTSIFNKLILAPTMYQTQCTPKETNLGKNNSEPKSTFDAFHVDGPHMK